MTWGLPVPGELAEGATSTTSGCNLSLALYRDINPGLKVVPASGQPCPNDAASSTETQVKKRNNTLYRTILLARNLQYNYS